MVVLIRSTGKFTFLGQSITQVTFNPTSRPLLPFIRTNYLQFQSILNFIFFLFENPIFGVIGFIIRGHFLRIILKILLNFNFFRSKWSSFESFSNIFPSIFFNSIFYRKICLILCESALFHVEMVRFRCKITKF